MLLVAHPHAHASVSLPVVHLSRTNCPSVCIHRFVYASCFAQSSISYARAAVPVAQRCDREHNSSYAQLEWRYSVTVFRFFSVPPLTYTKCTADIFSLSFHSVLLTICCECICAHCLCVWVAAVRFFCPLSISLTHSISPVLRVWKHLKYYNIIHTSFWVHTRIYYEYVWHYVLKIFSKHIARNREI